MGLRRNRYTKRQSHPCPIHIPNRGRFPRTVGARLKRTGSWYPIADGNTTSETGAWNHCEVCFFGDGREKCLQEGPTKSLLPDERRHVKAILDLQRDILRAAGGMKDSSENKAERARATVTYCRVESRRDARSGETSISPEMDNLEDLELEMLEGMNMECF